MTEVFSMVPPPMRAFWLLAGIGLVLLVVLGLLVYVALSSQRVRVEVGPAGVSVRGTLYGRTIPAGSLRAGEARPIDLSTAGDLAPRWRTNGIGLPGYAAGWFRLRNGSRALLFVTDRSRVVHVPTTEGYDLLVSVDRPLAFVEAVSRMAAAR